MDLNLNIPAAGHRALTAAQWMESRRLDAPVPPLVLPSPQERLVHGGHHFLDALRYRRAAQCLKAVLTAREATPENPLSTAELLLTLEKVSTNAEARVEVMNNANILPAGQGGDSTICRRRDANGVWFYHLQ